jgi:predicted DNA-binding protein (MmcQ/YjbR family)
MSLEEVAKKLRAEALKYPETYEEQPWGDRVVKVKGKIFFSCNVHKGELYSSCKLPKSSKKALERSYAEPTHYGMGKYGWVTFKFANVKDVPFDDLRAWMDESYRAIAPKTLLKELDAEPAPKKTAAAKTAKTPAQAKAKAATKARGKAILICADKLRADRAVKAMQARGIDCDVVADADKLKLGKARALVVDIGRNPPEGIALARKIDEGDAEVHLFIAGVRDAAQARELRDLGSAETFRAPPGDDAVADAVATALGGARRAP